MLVTPGGVKGLQKWNVSKLSNVSHFVTQAESTLYYDMYL